MGNTHIAKRQCAVAHSSKSPPARSHLIRQLRFRLHRELFTVFTSNTGGSQTALSVHDFTFTALIFKTRCLQLFYSEARHTEVAETADL